MGLSKFFVPAPCEEGGGRGGYCVAIAVERKVIGLSPAAEHRQRRGATDRAEMGRLNGRNGAPKVVQRDRTD